MQLASITCIAVIQSRGVYIVRQFMCLGRDFSSRSLQRAVYMYVQNSWRVDFLEIEFLNIKIKNSKFGGKSQITIVYGF